MFQTIDNLFSSAQQKSIISALIYSVTYPLVLLLFNLSLCTWCSGAATVYIAFARYNFKATHHHIVGKCRLLTSVLSLSITNLKDTPPTVL
jgi:hypothetical protein